METLSPVALGFLGSLAAGSMTAFGAIPVLFGRVPSRATRDLLLGFAAGGREGPEAASLRRVWLFVIAITIHNFPEGLAVGVGFGADGLSGGLPLAIGIGLQNAPEGLAVAVALLGEGYSRVRAWGIAALTGLVEPVGGLIGAGIITMSQPLLPWGLAFAAGAMLYVISHEIIPETHRSGHQNRATLGLAVGLVVMLFLDVWLG